MLRTRPAFRRHARSRRQLRVEHLEPRPMLAVIVPPPDPPPVITLHAANTITDFWNFEGTVTDNGYAVAGLDGHVRRRAGKISPHDYGTG